jgi:hypothetical protein
MDLSRISVRDILTVASERTPSDETNDYSVPAVQKWAFIVNINAIMAFVICILLVFMLHQKQYEFLIYRFTNLIGLALISLAVVSASIALDYAAVSIYRRARGSNSRTQCGQVLDYTAFFCVMASFVVSGWTGVGFMSALVSASPVPFALLA